MLVKVSSSLSSGTCVGRDEQKQAVFRRHKKLTLAAAAVLSWIGSLAGFGDLIGVIFPVFGYLSVVFLVCMMVHFIQCKRREKQSA